MPDILFFWWSIISTISALLLLIWDVWQLSASRKEKGIHKSQVKLWQHHANSISIGLLLIQQGQFENPDAMKVSVGAMQNVAQSLYKSLNEERFFTEDELKEQQLQQQNEFKEALDRANKARNQTS